MNIVEFFVRANLRRKIAKRRETVHDIDERLAALNELISHWKSYHTPDRPNVFPAYILEDVAKWKSERAVLSVRKPKIEQEILTLERQLTEEYRKQRSV